MITSVLQKYQKEYQIVSQPIDQELWNYLYQNVDGDSNNFSNVFQEQKQMLINLLIYKDLFNDYHQTLNKILSL